MLRRWYDFVMKGCVPKSFKLIKRVDRWVIRVQFLRKHRSVPLVFLSYHGGTIFMIILSIQRNLKRLNMPILRHYTLICNL